MEVDTDERISTSRDKNARRGDFIVFLRPHLDVGLGLLGSVVVSP
jgi:hypothetical protein